MRFAPSGEPFRMHFDPPDTILTLRMRLLRDVHEGTAFKDSLLSTKALPPWLGCALVVEATPLTLQDVHEGTAFKDSLPSTKALPLWLGLAMVVEGDGSDSTF